MAMLPAIAANKLQAPNDLRCNGNPSPLSIDTTTPLFSWKIPCHHQGQQQTAYEIEVASDSMKLVRGKADLWSSGKVDSPQQLFVAYGGQRLAERQLCYWRVRVWDEKGQRTPWSRPTRFAIGILKGMAGDYVGLDTENAICLKKTLKDIVPAGKQFRTTFVHVNSLGYHELLVNGKKVGDEVMQPAVSQLAKRSLIVTYDITPYLKKGDNEVEIWAARGWYTPSILEVEHLGALVKAEISQLTGTGWQRLAQTDGSWQAAASGYSYTGNWQPLRFGGERIDHTAKLQWTQAKTYKVTGKKATPQVFSGNHIIDKLSAKTITHDSHGAAIIDFGRVITGWLVADFEGLSKGQVVTFEYSDFIPNGKTFEPLEKEDKGDVLIASGTGADHFANRFHMHAFRYVKVDAGEAMGHKLKDIKAVQISGLKEEGASTFACSDDRLNTVHDLIHYTMRCLTFSGYMVDCPHLERLGYGGDGNSSTRTLQTMYEVNDTYRNWLTAWCDAMADDGGTPHAAPSRRCGGGPYWCGFIIKATWRTYQAYQDKNLIETMYPYMQKWLTYVDKYTVDGLLQKWPNTDYREWYLGDWLAPEGVDMSGESIDHVSNCFVSDCLRDMVQMAKLLGRKDDARQYAAKREALNLRIHEQYYHADSHTYANGTPLDMSYAVLTGVVPNDLLKEINTQIVRMSYEKYNGHVAVGLVGIPVFTEWATRQQEADLMATILRQRDYPGYLYMIDNGATATWEAWDSHRSRVHNCYNGIGTWFYEAVAGIQGTDEVVIAPQIPKGVEWCEASKPTPYGTLRVKWTSAGGTIIYDIDVPVGLKASMASGKTLVAGHNHVEEQ